MQRLAGAVVLLRGLAALAMLLLAGESLAADASYPARPVRLLLGFAAGGGTDVTARLLAAKVAERVGQPVLVENRPGGQGVIATQLAVRGAPDGYTLLYNTSSLVTSPALMRDPGYDWRRDLVPVAGLAAVPLILLVHPSVPARDAREFVALAKTRGGELSYASAGIGNATHLAALRLLQEVGASAVHIPYPGGGPALTDLLRGTVQFYMDTTNTALPHLRSGAARALGVGSAERLATLPDVPTLAETVAPGYTAESWQGLMAPAGTPDAVVRSIGAAFLAVLADAEVRARLAQMSVVPRPRSSQEYRAYLEDEARRWQAVIAASGLRLE